MQSFFVAVTACLIGLATAASPAAAGSEAKDTSGDIRWSFDTHG